MCLLLSLFYINSTFDSAPAQDTLSSILESCLGKRQYEAEGGEQGGKLEKT